MLDRSGPAAAGDKVPEGAALWRFSTAFYARPGVAEALLALQDRDRRDINLILFALWAGVSGRPRLTHATLAAAEAATAALRDELVRPLRALRRRLKSHPDRDLRCLREGVEALELAAEEAVQKRLAEYADPVEAGGRAARLVSARANLALCLGPDTAEAAIIRAALDAFQREDPS